MASSVAGLATKLESTTIDPSGTSEATVNTDRPPAIRDTRPVQPSTAEPDKDHSDAGSDPDDDDDDAGGFYDEVEIEDMEYDSKAEAYYFPCPCGDRFVITKAELRDGEEVARCPSCTLILKVIFDPADFEEEEESEPESDSD